MGNADQLTRPDSEVTPRPRRDLRFHLGILGLFCGTVELALLAFAVIAAVVPGWSPTVIASGSMEPALRRGDVVVYREQGETRTYEPGDVIVFDAGSGSTIHRIVAIDDEGRYVTQGDNAAERDSTPLDDDLVAGQGLIVIPFAGLPQIWLRAGAYLPLAALLIVTAGAFQTSGWSWIVPTGETRRRPSLLTPARRRRLEEAVAHA